MSVANAARNCAMLDGTLAIHQIRKYNARLHAYTAYSFPSSPLFTRLLATRNSKSLHPIDHPIHTPTCRRCFATHVETDVPDFGDGDDRIGEEGELVDDGGF